MDAQCAHTWEPTGLHFTSSGRKWQQCKIVSYCPQCRKFGTKTTMFLDGDMFKTQAAADAANEDERQRYNTAKIAWLREHYPDHVSAE